jgi:hypothetical protein
LRRAYMRAAISQEGKAVSHACVVIGSLTRVAYKLAGTLVGGWGWVVHPSGPTNVVVSVIRCTGWTYCICGASKRSRNHSSFTQYVRQRDPTARHGNRRPHVTSQPA